jgi:hypothetical protein
VAGAPFAPSFFASFAAGAPVKRTMAKALSALAETSDFTTFAGETAEDYDRMAATLYRRWPLPAAVEESDVRQELLLALVEREGGEDTPRLVERWDPSRGNTLPQFVVFQSYAKAKRELHRQRGALRLDGRNPGRFPLAFSSLGGERVDEGDDAERGREGVTDADQEEQVERAEMVRGFRDLLGGQVEREAFDALLLAGGCPDRAARMIDRDPGRSVRCRVGSEQEAAELVERVLDSLRRLAREVIG